MEIPNPGLDGTYVGSCVVCLEGTDSGVLIEGAAEFAAAALVHLGVPEDQVMAVISTAAGCPPGTLPTGRQNFILRVCKSCADKVGWPVGLISSGVLPGLVEGQS